MGDFSPATIHAATGPDRRVNVLPVNQDLFILWFNRALFDAAGLQVPKTFGEVMGLTPKLTDASREFYEA